MTIDAKKLEAAVARLHSSRCADTAELDLVIEAARAHLATLPRTKEVEVVQWVLVNDAEIIGSWSREEEAKAYANQFMKHAQAVRLTGTATVPA